MNCVNCGCRLTFFNETDELWSGTERSLCQSCRAKIAPFLEESYGESHVAHLADRKAALIAQGITAEGYAHLGEYCRYLDSLLKKPGIEAPRAEAERIGEDSSISQFEAFRRTFREEKSEEDAPRIDRGTLLILEEQKRANHAMRVEIQELGNEVREGTKLLSEKLTKTEERLRMMRYLAATGAGTSVLSFLAVLLLLVLR